MKKLARGMRRIIFLSGFLFSALFIWLLIQAPVLAVPICPNCYGFKKIASGVYVEKHSSLSEKAALKNFINQAKERV